MREYTLFFHKCLIEILKSLIMIGFFKWLPNSVPKSYHIIIQIDSKEIKSGDVGYSNSNVAKYDMPCTG